MRSNRVGLSPASAISSDEYMKRGVHWIPAEVIDSNPGLVCRLGYDSNGRDSRLARGLRRRNPDRGDKIGVNPSAHQVRSPGDEVIPGAFPLDRRDLVAPDNVAVGAHHSGKAVVERVFRFSFVGHEAPPNAPFEERSSGKRFLCAARFAWLEHRQYGRQAAAAAVGAFFSNSAICCQTVVQRL